MGGSGTARSPARPPRWRSHLLGLLEAALLLGVFLVILQAVLGISLTDAEIWTAFAFPSGRLGPLFSGLLGTLGYLAIVLPLGTAVGFLWGWARLSRHRVLSWPAGFLVEMLRGVPPIVLVIFAYLFGASILPRSWNPLGSALLLAAVALALHTAAYQAEIFRAGFQSVPTGQIEAAQSLGMSGPKVMARIILPQALRLSLPPLGNELATVIKDTSILGAVGALELFSSAGDFLGRPGVLGRIPWVLAVWVIVAGVYLIVTFAVTRGLRVIEQRLRVPGLEGMAA